jgi:uncharacterized protein YdeI (YjbR/CyaY-like superfamily)
MSQIPTLERGCAGVRTAGKLACDLIETMSIVFFSSSADFRRWLLGNHKRVDEIWVGFHKKSTGRDSITYLQALDEALCYGWIDGIRKSVNPAAYCVRFTPRKPKSQWSAVNIKRAEQLRAAGRMQPTGRKAFASAKHQPRAYSYEQRREATLDKEGERMFRANRRAWEFFQTQAPWYRRTSSFWIISAKKDETRKKRLLTLIADSEHGRLVKPLRRPTDPKRQKKVQ